jgi:hypothetical protein
MVTIYVPFLSYYKTTRLIRPAFLVVRFVPLNPNPETRNPKSKTRNLKPITRYLLPELQNPNPALFRSLACTGACRNPTTSSTDQGDRTVGFAPILSAGGFPQDPGFLTPFRKTEAIIWPWSQVHILRMRYIYGIHASIYSKYM